MHRLFALEEPSSDHYRRTRETAHELTATRIRKCRHGDDLARVGARFEPSRLPDGALERLIQQHPDPSIVVQLRAEGERRTALSD